MVKKLVVNAGDAGLKPGWGRSPGEGNGNPIQCSCLEKPGGATVHGVAKELDVAEHTGTPLSKRSLSFILWDPASIQKLLISKSQVRHTKP